MPFSLQDLMRMLLPMESVVLQSLHQLRSMLEILR